MEKIVFSDENGIQAEFYIVEQTRMNGCLYLLVADSMEEEANAYIMKDLSEDTDSESVYVPVEDEVEFETISQLFASLLEDVDLV